MQMHSSTPLSASRLETVSDSAQRLQITGMPWIAFDFLPQTPHKYINGTRRHEGAFFPHRVKQLVAGKDASTMPGQIFEQPELANRSEDSPALYAHGHRGDINFQISQLNNLVTGSVRLNAKNVADSGNQFTGTEGFGNVAISAGVESLKAIRFLSSGGKKDDWRLAQSFVLTDLAAKIEAAHPGKHNIEKKQRWVGHGCHWNHRRPGEECGDLVSGVSQIVFDQARHIRIVFHDVDQIRVARFVCRLQRIHGRKESPHVLSQNPLR